MTSSTFYILLLLGAIDFPTTNILVSSFSLIPHFSRSARHCAPSALCWELNRGTPSSSTASITTLSMGKGFNRMKKQSDIKKANNNKDSSQPKSGDQKSQESIRETNDLKRFEYLLDSDTRSIDAYDDDNYLTPEQEEKEMTASFTGVDRIFEGDPAPDMPFEDLINMRTGVSLKKEGAEQLLPWRNDKKKPNDFMLVISDPRPKSSALRSTVLSAVRDLPRDALDRLIIINVDTPQENSKFAKKNKLWDQNFKMFSDSNRDWMKSYTALGEERWTICAFLLSRGRVEHLIREVDPEISSNQLISLLQTFQRRSL
mmetsp:Transcript_55474/g.64865  ORF Transcript_55474/g.64865 Transcript_55474/m.64865 type:complete len:315 (+) Transcript_55474:60-1004(+)